jgi:hypothetical protein
MSNIDTEFAYDLGAEMAEYVNDHPEEAQNWSPINRGNDIPTEDYVQISRHYGFDDLDAEEIAEIEQAYRDGFNGTFDSEE